jgi:hypothetical protein
MKDTIELSGLEINKIIRGPKRNHPYDKDKLKKDSPLIGQTYSQFIYQGVVFNAPDSKGFDRDYELGEIEEVSLLSYTEKVKVLDKDDNEIETEVRRLDFTTHVNTTQYDNFEAKTQRRQLRRSIHNAKLNAIESGAIKADVLLTEDDLALLATS